MNTQKKLEYKKLNDKVKNIEMLDKISSGLDLQKELMVFRNIFMGSVQEKRGNLIMIIRMVQNFINSSVRGKDKNCFNNLI